MSPYWWFPLSPEVYSAESAQEIDMPTPPLPILSK